jgi:hypothetical protein
MTQCSNCRYFKASRKGRCYGCDKFFRAMGTERPDSLIERAISRWLHRGMNVESHACSSTTT